MNAVVSSAVNPGYPVHVEVHVAPGLPGLDVIGWPGGRVRELRDRVRAAVLTSGYDWPQRRITVSVAPAITPTRRGVAGLDLAIAAGILAASEQIELPDRGYLGELGLDGAVRPFYGLWQCLPACPSAEPFPAHLKELR